jgi:hypothetical protein
VNWFILLLFLLSSLGCADNSRADKKIISVKDQLPFIKANTKGNLKEKRLGESNYYLMLPINFELSEARGKEGGLGYNIIPRDPSSTILGFIEIEHGNPMGGPLFPQSKFFAKSNLLDKIVEWEINKEGGYYYAFSKKNGNLSATAFSQNLNEIDSLISIISTLKQK